ncbi:MAG: hypothetical protein HY057_06560 [Rhodospirillales bacterium]|nr:hypothetical protein [Rhodospirillales bacterium]
MAGLKRKLAIGRGVAVAGLLALAGCAASSPFPGLPEMRVSTDFGLKNLCGLGVSPQIRLRNVPAGTVSYTVRMTNIDALVNTPWQATVLAEGRDIPEGAGADFPAPCPGEAQAFRYRFEVLALDAGARPLAYGKAIAVAGPIGPIVRNERARVNSGAGPVSGAGDLVDDQPIPSAAGAPIIRY